jgi:glycosyltransferase involved in cell wall biosynthesis
MIYPPVWSEFPEVAWTDRSNAFAMIGRISPEKQVERAISILDAVRRLGHSVQLHLCGQIEDDRYGRQITELCRANADWIIPEGRVTGERKADILSRCRYGIQTRSAEPFGISVAEMVKAGEIVFVPHDGGQAEIVENPDLLFADNSDAVAKICRVLDSPELQLKLHRESQAKSRCFLTESFVKSFQEFVRRDRVAGGAGSIPGGAVRL